MKHIDRAADLFKALGHQARLHIMVVLLEKPRSVGEITEAVDLSQPMASQHLRTLREAGLVTAAREGREVIYSVSDEHIGHVLADALEHVQEE
ncbi:ArsR/SmtB family transcription factor [Dermatophilus congolensis]|uniref:Uncharacterized HTH-type transcriptional regulator Rv0081/MT0088 n=2 Tax=Dermatophilus congolensis TaxID=1863 RepID=A0A239VSA8_9MICO|nr:metalloregulator ArsR/SmtB family transcription factor [Dermatophilus congolensis]MBO3129892.1 helix-turn-helix transcriptional regulator [Dermatophilus congolensis]MBO3131478.1 helix-turn-helix transcriptional regulator [Dermatophilus congolensis]MBO3134366.1 helix-turn-helix transcriptional regulator [Dermatophilus congolensis]MBO3136601.1 helix-turn-helix transcriptional regulator [Dermatophilus congolensis]MBO3138845.1 helix-turn-helix transcriptional regulator [Dermatophilus congolensi